jgi:DNA sulfur modification protein DndB
MNTATIQIVGQLGRCGDREVFMGFAKASLLAEVSFADALDETTGTGYQRRFNRQHSLEFKRYIQKAGASTIPLTFNLRPEFAAVWRIERSTKFPGMAVLFINSLEKPVMAQVDCQHRLGYMGGSNVEFAFMTYLGLSVTQEMEIFRDINGKAKGLSSSLLDYTEARLVGDMLPTTNPDLYHAMQLSQNPKSPWCQRLNLGGKQTIGTKRIASLRTMQNAVHRFFSEAQLPPETTAEVTTEILINFWSAIALVLPFVWNNPRQHLVTKGIGVYSLMSIAGDLVREACEEKRRCDLDYFVEKLSDFVEKVDWTNNGAMKGYGGTGGADAALELLRHTRKQSLGSAGTYGKQEYSIS